LFCFVVAQNYKIQEKAAGLTQGGFEKNEFKGFVSVEIQ